MSTIAEAKLPTTDWCAIPETLEDLVPPPLLSLAVERFAKQRWNQDQHDHKALLKKWNESESTKGADRLVELTRHAGGGLASQADGFSLRAGVFESLSRVLVDGDSDLHEFEEDLNQLEQVFRAICDRLVGMLKVARTESRQDRLQKSVRLEVERYRKIHGKAASKADVRRCLSRLESLAIGTDAKSRKVRENSRWLQDRLDEGVAHAGFSVDVTK